MYFKLKKIVHQLNSVAPRKAKIAYWDTDLNKSVDFFAESHLHIACCLY